MTQSLASIGTTVHGRPWIDGTEQTRSRRALVLLDERGYLLVWYPGLGMPLADGDTPAVQGLLRSKVHVGTAHNLVDAPDTWVANAYRLAKRANRGGEIREYWRPAFLELEREARARARRAALEPVR